MFFLLIYTVLFFFIPSLEESYLPLKKIYDITALSCAEEMFWDSCARINQDLNKCTVLSSVVAVGPMAFFEHSYAAKIKKKKWIFFKLAINVHHWLQLLKTDRNVKSLFC